jgi:hypothetical protein
MGALLVCRDCGSTTMKPKTVTKGSFAMEIVLWLLFLLPGFCYSVWRMTTRHKACPACSGEGLLPTNTPLGQKLLTQVQSG